MKVVENNSRVPRFAFLVAAGVGLVAGLVAALGLLGVAPVPARLAADHGPLMVFGFVGGAIGLERTVAVRASWAWAGPVFHVLGVMTLLAGAPPTAPAFFFALSFVVLGAIYTTIYRRQATLSILVQATGVVGGVSAAVLWGVGFTFATAMPLAVLYVVATIIGERMELARLTVAGTSAEVHITVAVYALALAALVFLESPAIGYVLMGVALMAVAIVTARVDVARRLVHGSGLPRYSAACMLAGYLWLVLAGVVRVAFGHEAGGLTYDVAVHAVFVGFVMSMIFAHAPIIVTSVLRVKVPYHPALYAPLVLLQASLVVRFIGDARGAIMGWQAGGIVGVVAIICFLATAITLGIRHARKEA